MDSWPPIDWRDYIAADPEIIVGKPRIEKSRISVNHILGNLAAGWTIEEISDAYVITKEDILACLFFAMETVKRYGVQTINDPPLGPDPDEVWLDSLPIVRTFELPPLGTEEE